VELSVPPGAAPLEKLFALAPGMADSVTPIRLGERFRLPVSRSTYLEGWRVPPEAG